MESKEELEVRSLKERTAQEWVAAHLEWKEDPRLSALELDDKKLEKLAHKFADEVYKKGGKNLLQDYVDARTDARLNLPTVTAEEKKRFWRLIEQNVYTLYEDREVQAYYKGFIKPDLANEFKNGANPEWSEDVLRAWAAQEARIDIRNQGGPKPLLEASQAYARDLSRVGGKMALIDYINAHYIIHGESEEEREARKQRVKSYEAMIAKTMASDLLPSDNQVNAMFERALKERFSAGVKEGKNDIRNKMGTKNKTSPSRSTEAEH